MLILRFRKVLFRNFFECLGMNPQSLFQDFKNKLEDWRQMYEEAVDFGEIPKGMMDDLTNCCKSVESIR